MFKKITFFILLFFIIIIISGCSFKKTHLKKSVSYTPRALSYYYYLKFLELNRKERKEAVLFLKKAIKYYPSPDLYLEAGHFYLKNKNIKQAEEFVKKGLQKFPGEKKLTFFLYRLYLLKKQKLNALSLLQIYLKKHPKDKEALKNLAFLYFEEKKYKKAAQVLKKISEKDFTTCYFLAQIYIKLNNHNSAIKYLKKAIHLKVNFLKAWAELGYQLEIVNDYAGAEEAYYFLYKKGIKNNEIRLKLIELNIKLNNLEKAFKIVKKSPEDTDFIFKATILFIHEGFYDYGEKVLNLLSKPYTPNLLYVKAFILYKKYNKLTEAISLLKKIPQNVPIHKDALILLVRLYLKSKKENKAFEIVKEGQKYYSDEIFWILEEQIWYSRKKYQKALEIVNNALRKFPESVELLYQKGVIMYKLKKIKESINIMENVLKLQPNHADALNFIGYTLADKGEKLERALKLIKRALKIEPTNGYYLDSLAWTYYKMGNYTKAWETIKRAVKSVKDDAIIWEHYGDIALSLKLFKEAIRGYKNSLKLGSENSKSIKRKLNNINSLKMLQKTNDK